MKILFEDHKYRAYSPVVITGGIQQSCKLHVQALRRAGHQVTHVVSDNPTGASDVVVIPRDYWFGALTILSRDHDVVVLNYIPTPGLLRYPELIKKALIIEHGASGGPEKLQLAVNKLGGTFVSVDIGSPLDSHHAGYLNNQCVTPDRCEMVWPYPKLIVAVGRNDNDKRLQLAADAMRVLRIHGYEGVIFTDDYIHGTPIEYDDVRIGVPHVEIMDWMSVSRCLLQPSAVEGNGGRVTFEAAQHGTPVIHCISNADYFLVPSGTSVKVEPTVDSFVQAVLRPEQSNEKRVRSRAWFDENYNEEKFVQRLVLWLERVMLPKAPTPLPPHI